METVCEGKRWDVWLATDGQGRVLGAMPYLWGKKLGLKYVIQPQLTQYNGPWISPHADDQLVSAQLAAQVRQQHLALFLQNFAPTLSPADSWTGFNISERVTYRINDISDPQRVFALFDKSRRQRQIRRAEKRLHPVEVTPEGFAQFHQDYWHHRGQKDLLSQDFMIRVITAALERKQGILLGVADEHNTLMAARFVAYDSHCAYSLLSALHPQHPNGASALLFWLIIQQLSGHTQSFDFEGSMDPGIALSYSLYGAQPTTYCQVMRCPNPLLRILLKI